MTCKVNVITGGVCVRKGVANNTVGVFEKAVSVLRGVVLEKHGVVGVRVRVCVRVCGVRVVWCGTVKCIVVWNV